jgi:hypothetical protein
MRSGGVTEARGVCGITARGPARGRKRREETSAASGAAGRVESEDGAEDATSAARSVFIGAGQAPGDSEVQQRDSRRSVPLGTDSIVEQQEAQQGASCARSAANANATVSLFAASILMEKL